MAELLDIVPIKPPEGDKVVPIMLDFVVDPESEPYLVSSTSDLVWVTGEALDSNNRIRAAVRLEKGSFGGLYLDVVEAIEACALVAEWGNVLPHTRKGVADGIAYLREFGIPEVEILTSKKVSIMYQNHGALVRPCTWIPPGLAVIVPRDRGFFGTLGKVGNTRRVVVAVHNPSRGIAICRDQPQQAPPERDTEPAPEVPE